MERPKKPIRIDSLIHNSLRNVVVNDENTEWYVAKPSTCDCYLIDRLYHAYLVLVGKAIATQYKEDID